MRKSLKNNVGIILGYIEETSTKITLYNLMSRELGYYDKKTDETWQVWPIKKLIGREGNLVITLLDVSL
jgi:hypothetical protein